MEKIFLILQLVSALLLTGAVLLQQRGTALGGAFGGGGEFYRTRRGIEKILFQATIVLAALFAVFTLLSILFRGR